MLRTGLPLNRKQASTPPRRPRRRRRAAAAHSDCPPVRGVRVVKLPGDHPTHQQPPVVHGGSSTGTVPPAGPTASALTPASEPFSGRRAYARAMCGYHTPNARTYARRDGKSRPRTETVFPTEVPPRARAEPWKSSFRGSRGGVWRSWCGRSPRVLGWPSFPELSESACRFVSSRGGTCVSSAGAAGPEGSRRVSPYLCEWRPRGALRRARGHV